MIVPVPIYVSVAFEPAFFMEPYAGPVIRPHLIENDPVSSLRRPSA